MADLGAGLLAAGLVECGDIDLLDDSPIVCRLPSQVAAGAEGTGSCQRGRSQDQVPARHVSHRRSSHVQGRVISIQYKKGSAH